MTAYALAFGGLLLLGGRLGDLFGRKRVLIAGSIGFAAAAPVIPGQSIPTIAVECPRHSKHVWPLCVSFESMRKNCDAFESGIGPVEIQKVVVLC